MIEDNLYETIKSAYIYSFPVYDMYKTGYEITVNPSNLDRVELNQFHHHRQLADHTFRKVTSPNNDTLYSVAWLDLSTEPVILTVPDTADRYYVLGLLDFFTNNFANIGRSTTGTSAGNFLICGPDYSGASPDQMPIYRSPTNSVWVLGRTMVKGETDLPNVHQIQDQYRLNSLSSWNEPQNEIMYSNLPKSPPSITPQPDDIWNFFKVVNLGLTENPPPSEEADLMKNFARINVGPNQKFDEESLDEHQKKIWIQAMHDARKEIEDAFFKIVENINGWGYTPEHITGNYGDNYLVRAYQCLTGLGTVVPAEARYLRSVYNRGEEPFSGRKRYLLRFEKGHMPPVEAFWSLSMYEISPEGRLYFPKNPINRYAIGDRTVGLQYNSDVSLDIYIQHESPGADHEANWLPAPKGLFLMTMRAFQPKTAILNREYLFPEVQIVKQEFTG